MIWYYDDLDDLTLVDLSNYIITISFGLFILNFINAFISKNVQIV